MERSVYRVIEKLSKREGVSLSQKTRDLLLEALELTEDLGLETIVQRRKRNAAPSVSHETLKRRLGIR